MNPQTAEEVVLAQALISGDSSAFDRFADIFREKLFHYTYMMCGQREDAEEVAQETLLKVYESFDQLREAERVKPWVFRIARNNCLMKRRRSIFAPPEEISLDEQVYDGSGNPRPRIDPVDASELPDASALRHELRTALDQAIRELPPMYRAVVLLRDVEEMSTDDTAEILDVSTDVVKTRLRRARLALRQRLEERRASM